MNKKISAEETEKFIAGIMDMETVDAVLAIKKLFDENSDNKRMLFNEPSYIKFLTKHKDAINSCFSYEGKTLTNHTENEIREIFLK